MNRDISTIPITPSNHRPSDGMSIMELVAYTAGRSPTDQPGSVSPVLREWIVAWADWLDDDARQQLRRYVLPLANSLGDIATEARRQWRVVDWFLRADVPIWLHLCGLQESGDALAASPWISSPRQLAEAQAALEAAQGGARATNVKAWGAIGRTLARHPMWQIVVDAAQRAAGDALTLTEPAARAVGYGRLAPDETPSVWRCGVEAIENVLMALSWTALNTMVADWQWSSTATAAENQQAVYATVRSAFYRGEVATNDAAHRLTEQLLDIGYSTERA